jgi:acetyl-CoA carboxylase biotin carboxyl carrier protein
MRVDRVLEEDQMELKDLRSLIRLITETDITEFNLEDAEGKIQIKRGAEKEFVQIMAPTAAPVASAGPVVSTVPAVSEAPSQGPSEPANDNYEAISAPMVGTFYRRPSPDAEMFCSVGDVVEPGQSLGLIEAMKLFNDIEAEFKCRIIEIFKDNAAPVEYGETLFLVERL